MQQLLRRVVKFLRALTLDFAGGRLKFHGLAVALRMEHLAKRSRRRFRGTLQFGARPSRQLTRDSFHLFTNLGEMSRGLNGQLSFKIVRRGRRFFAEARGGWWHGPRA